MTIGYNIIERLVSTIYAASDETLALFGFGLDSFAEVLTGIGIAHMLFKMRQNSLSNGISLKLALLG